MKKDGNILRDAGGHECYVCRMCPSSNQKLIRKNRKGYEECQKLGLCLLCYNLQLEDGRSNGSSLKEDKLQSINELTAATSDLDETGYDSIR